MVLATCPSNSLAAANSILGERLGQPRGVLAAQRRHLLLHHLHGGSGVGGIVLAISRLLKMPLRLANSTSIGRSPSLPSTNSWKRRNWVSMALPGICDWAAAPPLARSSRFPGDFETDPGETGDFRLQPLGDHLGRRTGDGREPWAGSGSGGSSVSFVS